MNMYSSQSSWIDGGHRLRLRRRWLAPLLPALKPAPALPIRRRGLLRLLLTIAFFWLMRSLLLAELDRGDPAVAADGAGCRLAVATVTVSSDEHEHASSSLLSAEQVAAAGNIIFLYYDYGSWYPVLSLSGIRSIMMAIMANGRGAS